MHAASLRRRAFLKATGISIALPALESLETRAHASGPIQEPPQRVVCIGNEFGMYPGSFWPKTFGRDYEMTPLLQPLARSQLDGSVCRRA